MSPKTLFLIQQNEQFRLDAAEAFRKAGILPYDLPKFLEAVRASQKIYNFAFDLADGPRPQDDETLGDVRLSAMKAVSEAAACLPENKRSAE